MNVDLAKTYKRAEFWEEGEATALDIINVLGRWESANEWSERTRFSVVENPRDEDMAQGATVERYEKAKRLKMVERVAMAQNVPSMPFRDEKLAAAAGKTVEEMNAMPLSEEAVEITFDALSQSKSSLIPAKTIDERRAKMIAADGSFDDGAFMAGMTSSRIAVVTGFFLLGKGQLYGYVVAGKIALDASGLYDQIKAVLGPFTEPIGLIATSIAVVYAYQQDAKVKRETSNYETYTLEEANAKEATLEKSYTVFDKLAPKPPKPEQ